MDEIEITPLTGPLDARVVLPGSKSITNRAMVLAALAQGRSVIESVLLSDDTRYELQSAGAAARSRRTAAKSSSGAPAP